MRHHRPPQRPSHRPPSSPFPGRPRPRVQDIFAHYPSDHPSSFPKDFIQLKDVKALGERPTPPGGPIPSRLEQPVAREHTRSPTLLVPEPTLPSRSLAEEVRERSRTTADSLPEDVLVELFDLYREEPFSRRRDNWDWHKIAHVCRKWREVVLASALRLDLQLYCTYRIPVDKMLSHSPAFPIVIEYVYGRMLPQDKDSILSALQQPHRVRKINISAHDPTMHAIVMAACDSFPLLDSLELRSSSQNTFVVPGTFLRGDAPQLRYIRLDGVALPARSPLLASTRSLVELHLERIPTEARTPVDVLLSALHRMPQLGYFSIHFLATPTRSPATGSLVHAEAPVVLPALERLRFRGDSAYLEEFLERCIIPLIKNVDITLYNELILTIPHTSRLLGLAASLRSPFAQLSFSANSVIISMQSRLELVNVPPFRLSMICTPLDWQVAAITQICGQLSLALSNLEQLSFRFHLEQFPSEQRGEVEPSQWRELLEPFRGVRELLLESGLVWELEGALDSGADSGDVPDELLPELRTVLVEVPDLHSDGSLVRRAFGGFARTRRLAGHPINLQYVGFL